MRRASMNARGNPVSTPEAVKTRAVFAKGLECRSPRAQSAKGCAEHNAHARPSGLFYQVLEVVSNVPPVLRDRVVKVSRNVCVQRSDQTGRRHTKPSDSKQNHTVRCLARAV